MGTYLCSKLLLVLISLFLQYRPRSVACVGRYHISGRSACLVGSPGAVIALESNKADRRAAMPRGELDIRVSSFPVCSLWQQCNCINMCNCDCAVVGGRNAYVCGPWFCAATNAVVIVSCFAPKCRE